MNALATKQKTRMIELRNLRAPLVEQVSAVYTKMDTENRLLPSDDEKAQIKSLEDQIRDYEKEANDLAEFSPTKSLGDGFQFPGDDPAPDPRGGGTKALTVGERFLEDDAIKSWLKSVTPHGQVQSAEFKASPRMEFDGLKALITGASNTSAGAFMVTDRKPIVDEGTFYRPLMIRDLVTPGTTDTDNVSYVRQGTHTNAAAVVPETTSVSDALGAKPESTMVLSVVTELVKNIATWIPATRRALADFGQIRTLIDTFLKYDLELTLENQMISGNGVGENFTGILNTSGISAQAFSTDILTTTRKARTKVKIAGRANANGYALHPNDWETIDLTTDNERRYYFGGPSVLGTPRLWGLPVVETEAVSQGTGICADWRLAILWDRQEATIYTSDSHQDFFIKNMIAILAEMRCGFGVIRPPAFCSVAFS